MSWKDDYLDYDYDPYESDDINYELLDDFLESDFREWDIVKTGKFSVSPREYNGKMNQTIGKWVEYYAEKLQAKQGYEVLKIVLDRYPKSHELNYKIRHLKNLYEDYKYIEYIQEIIEKFIEENEGSLAGLPDYLCIKEDDFLFLECKSPTSLLNPKQLKFAEFCLKEDVPFMIFEGKINKKNYKLEKYKFYLPPAG